MKDPRHIHACGRGEHRGEGRHGPGHGGPRGRRGGRGRLFDYGELRLLVLAMTATKPRHGYELIKEISDRFGGRYSPSPGVIYPTLSWLEDVGYISISADDGGRKLSTLTEAGQTFLEANRQAADELLVRELPQGRPEHIPAEIGDAMDHLKLSLRQRLSRESLSEGDIRSMAEAVWQAARWINGSDDTPMQPATPSGPGMTETTADTTAHASVITRHRHDLKRRLLTVAEVSRLTPHMIRIVLSGDDLDDFVSLGFDDHIKLFFDGGGDKPMMREYTPRAFDCSAKTLTLDFAVHEAGPATAWAIGAKPGDSLRIGGPRGSAVIAPVFDWYLLIGDETALPAIGRGVEGFGGGIKVITLAAIPEEADQQNFETKAELESFWVYRPGEAADRPEALLEGLKSLTLPEGKGFIWIAAESGVAKALKTHVLEELKHPTPHLKASGYWTKGIAAGGNKTLD